MLIILNVEPSFWYNRKAYACVVKALRSHYPVKGYDLMLYSPPTIPSLAIDCYEILQRL